MNELENVTYVIFEEHCEQSLVNAWDFLYGNDVPYGTIYQQHISFIIY